MALPKVEQLYIFDAHKSIYPGETMSPHLVGSQAAPGTNYGCYQYIWILASWLRVWLFDCSLAHEGLSADAHKCRDWQGLALGGNVPWYPWYPMVTLTLGLGVGVVRGKSGSMALGTLGFTPAIPYLNVNNLNVNPGGKQKLLQDTIIPLNNPPPQPSKVDTQGMPQWIVFTQDHPYEKLQGVVKGMKVCFMSTNQPGMSWWKGEGRLWGVKGMHSTTDQEGCQATCGRGQRDGERKQHHWCCPACT